MTELAHVKRIWARYVGESRKPEELVRRSGGKDPWWAASWYVYRLPFLYGRPLPSDWRKAFRRGEDWSAGEVIAYLAEYMDATREQWEPEVHDFPERPSVELNVKPRRTSSMPLLVNSALDQQAPIEKFMQVIHKRPPLETIPVNTPLDEPPPSPAHSADLPIVPSDEDVYPSSNAGP